jgi:hypothetical protein
MVVEMWRILVSGSGPDLVLQRGKSTAIFIDDAFTGLRRIQV